MNSPRWNRSSGVHPDVSLIMPCYNEEQGLAFAIPALTRAFESAGYRLELVAVDNGSSDRTGEIIRELAARDDSVVCHTVDRNEGYGNGVLSAIPVCTAPWIGIVHADGQVDADDVVGLYEAAASAQGKVLAKARRHFRMDGLWRKIVSVAYNAFMRVLWPTLGSIDVNGNPKIVSRDVVTAMNLKSKGWLIDPEILVKARYLGVRVLEFNVFARPRRSGLSHVRVSTCWEFLWKLFVFRCSSAWRRDLRPIPRP